MKPGRNIDGGREGVGGKERWTCPKHIICVYEFSINFKKWTYNSARCEGFLLESHRSQWELSGVLGYAFPLGIVSIVLDMTQEHILRNITFRLSSYCLKSQAWSLIGKHFQLKMLSRQCLQENRKLIIPCYLNKLKTFLVTFSQKLWNLISSWTRIFAMKSC